jgi:hypothetical protein
MLYIGIGLFLVMLLIASLLRRRRTLDLMVLKPKAGIWRSYETVGITWFFWTVGLTLVPINRIEAWFQFGGLWVSALAVLTAVFVPRYMRI